MSPADIPPVVIVDNPKTNNIPVWKRPIIGVIAVILIILIGACVYIMSALGPVDSSSSRNVRFVVTAGESATDIAKSLHDNKLINDPFVFQLYTQLTGKKSQLQAGGYILKKSYSLSEIVDHISSGKTDEVSVTILPGLTLEQLADPEVKGSLAQQGFTRDEITSAYSATYDSKLLEGISANDSLEGYIYPETYRMLASDTLTKIFQLSFDELSELVDEQNITAKLQQQGLSLRQGIILASIVQKEVSDASEQKQVAQVFHKRLKEGVVLGSDVTFMYIAEREGREPSVNDPSPYNTRKNGGLPPGPISNFTFSALLAVAEPAPGDFMYFVAGDDGTTHFAKTQAEHESNVSKYCTTLCQ
ncbi:MAG: endolytic transglycosylase MltG [Candidatus Saccharimonadales bacterium]